VKQLVAKLSGEPVASASMQAASASTPAAARIADIPAPAAAAKSTAPTPEVAAKSTAVAPAVVVAKHTAAASPAASAAMVAKTSASPAAATSAGDADFHDAVEEMVRGLPIAGPKVGSVQWPDKLKARVMMDNFPMDQMPPFAKTKFLSDLKAGIDSAKKDNNISSPVEVNIVDSASGHVMETITQ
jgi:hypothetical protein